MSSPSSLSPSAMSGSPAPGSSVAGKGGGFRSELAAMFPVVRGADVGGSGSSEGSWSDLCRPRSMTAVLWSRIFTIFFS